MYKKSIKMIILEIEQIDKKNTRLLLAQKIYWHQNIFNEILDSIFNEMIYTLELLKCNDYEN